MSIGLDTATLIALCVESVLFGLLVALVTITIHLLVVNKRIRHLQKSIIVVASLMLLLGFIHLVVDMQRVVGAFTGDNRDPVGYLNDLARTTYEMKNAIFVLQTLLGDGFVIYRLYIVWNYKKWLIVLPLLFLAASAVTGIYTIHSEARLASSAPIFSLKDWIATVFSITLLTNFSCTALIAYKIWSTTRKTDQILQTTNAQHKKSNSALIIIVESGAIYSASLISLLATFLSGSWGQYIVLDAVVPIVGIVFTLIIVRIGLGLSSDKVFSEQTTRQTRLLDIKMHSRGSRSGVTPVEVQMTTQKFEERDRSLTRTRDGTESNSTFTYDLEIPGKAPESQVLSHA